MLIRSRTEAVLVALAAAALVAVPVQAFADEPADCGAAVLAATSAARAYQDAAAADKAAADAAAADKAAEVAAANLEDARKAAVLAGVPSANLTEADAKRLRDERAALLAKEDRTDADIARLDAISKRLPLIEAAVAAQVTLGKAQDKANETDAAALQLVADRTDAAALGKAADAARAAAGEACKGADGTPVATPSATAGPAPTSAPVTDPSVVVVPDTSEGIDTGSA